MLPHSKPSEDTNSVATHALPSQRAMGHLNDLRVAALGCRASAYADLTNACALLAAARETGRMAHAEVLVRCLAQAIGSRPLFHRPGSTEISFDEAWIARLIETAEQGDDESFAFLIKSRVPHWARRNIAYLIRSISGKREQI